MPGAAPRAPRGLRSFGAAAEAIGKGASHEHTVAEDNVADTGLRSLDCPGGLIGRDRGSPLRRDVLPRWGIRAWRGHRLRRRRRAHHHSLFRGYAENRRTGDFSAQFLGQAVPRPVRAGIRLGGTASGFQLPGGSGWPAHRFAESGTRLRVASADGKSVKVAVAAGSAEVRNAGGLLVARVLPGVVLQLQRRRRQRHVDRYRHHRWQAVLLTDETTKVKVESAEISSREWWVSASP